MIRTVQQYDRCCDGGVQEPSDCPAITVQGDAGLLLQFGLLKIEYMTDSFRERCIGVCTADCAHYETAKASRQRTVRRLLRTN